VTPETRTRPQVAIMNAVHDLPVLVARDKGFLQGRGARPRVRDHAGHGPGHDLAHRQVRFRLRASARLRLQRGGHRLLPHVRMGHHKRGRRGQRPGLRGRKIVALGASMSNSPSSCPVTRRFSSRDAEGQGDRGDAEQRLGVHDTEDDGRLSHARARQEDNVGSMLNRLEAVRDARSRRRA